MAPPDSMMNKVISVLVERENNYDSPYDNFRRISAFDAILNECPDGPQKVALRNIGQKMARLIYAIIQTEHRAPTDLEWRAIEDGWTDICGYSLCGLRVSDHHRQSFTEPTAKE